MIHVLSTIAEIDAALAADPTLIDDAKAIMEARASRGNGSSSAKRAAAWLRRANGEAPLVREPKVDAHAGEVFVRGDEFTPTRKAARALAIVNGTTAREELAKMLSPEDLALCIANATAAKQGRWVPATA